MDQRSTRRHPAGKRTRNEHLPRAGPCRCATSTAAPPVGVDYLLRPRRKGRPVGAIGPVRAWPIDPRSTRREVADTHPVHACPAGDLIDVTIRMADGNPITLPVVKVGNKILGVTTGGDAGEAAISQDWRRREPRLHHTHYLPPFTFV